MTAKQIHELDPAPELQPEDLIVVSTAAAQLTRRASLDALPYRAEAGAVRRPLRARLADFVSVRDFGAAGDGVQDDAPAFTAALQAHEAVWVPPGTYRLAAPVDVPPARTIVGAGRHAVEIRAEGAHAFLFHRNAGAFQIDPAADDNWNRSSLGELSIRMSLGGIRVFGHEFRAHDLVFKGGAAPLGQDDPDGWCIDMVDANECSLVGIGAGFGGGGNTLAANGIRWRGTIPGVNFGDSLIQEVAIKLGADSTVGVLLDGSRASAANVINNMILQRIQIHAPGTGGARPGTTGIRLVNCARILLLLCDVEMCEVGFEEYSEQAGSAGQNSAITYILCQTHNIPDLANRYRDSNAAFTMSCVKRTFLGCNFMGPQPVGNYPGDGGVLGDTGLVAREINGVNKFDQLAWQIRARETGMPMITAHYKGAAQADWDTHPANDNPYHGILFDLTSTQLATITRTVANGVLSPDDGTTPLQDVRLRLGNGEGSSRGELARVEIGDPLYLAPRTTPAPRQIEGIAVYAADAAALPATDEQWLGRGWYLRLEDEPGNFVWVPLGVRRGTQPERERNVDWTVSRADFGKLHRVNNAAERVCTIPAGLVTPGEGLRWFDVVKQGTGDVVFQAGAGVTLRLPKGKNRIRTQFQRVRVYVTGSNEVYIPDLFPDADENYFQPLHWTGGGFAVPASYVGRLVRVSNANPTFLEVPPGLVPPGVDAVWFKVMKAGPGDVEIRAAAGMTLVAPGGVDPYVITQVNRVVTVHVTAADDPHQPDRVYIED